MIDWPAQTNPRIQTNSETRKEVRIPMNSQQILIHDVLVDHPVKAFFNVNTIKCVAGQARLTFKLRDDFSGRDFESAGTLGLVVDYVVRMLGNNCLEYCFLLEQEIHFYSHTLESS